MGAAAVEAIKQGQRNVMIGIRNSDPVLVPFSECIRTDKAVDKRLISVLNELSI
jgi:6-phosphofructokinase 1